MKGNIQQRDFSISFVIPAYNEEENIGELLDKINEICSDKDEIIVVNDCSKDKTKEIAQKKGAKVISHPYNMGNGAAIKTGIRNSKGDVIVMLDGDGQHSPSYINELLKYISDYDMVVGARQKDSHANFLRKLANNFYNFLASYVSGFNVEDLTCGFRAIKREVALKYLYLLPNTFSYPTTITLSLLKTGRSIKYVPIKAFKRKGKSKINLLIDGTRFLLIIIKITTLFSPLKIFLPVSGMFFLLGMTNYLYTFFKYHRFTNMSALLFITSIIVFLLGIVSEQISQLRLDRTEE